MIEGSKTREYSFGGFRVFADRGQILRGNEQVAITPKAVKLLVTLIERHERVVSKDELIALVWPGLFVEEGNVKFQISVIRRTLGHDVVTTVGKAGYQFVATLERRPGVMPETNLPARSRALIGRETDLELADAMLLEHPLVTVHGTGGVGKTSVAKAVGRRVLTRMEGGVWFLDVSPLINEDAIAAGFAALIGTEIRSGTGGVDELVRAIGNRRLLMILDGCEQVRSAVAGFVASLTERCPNLSVLATSRIPLRLPAERLLRLEPLATSGEAATAAEAGRIPAVAMLLDRAEAADVKFSLHDLDAAKAIDLCRLLDGLPLALEIVGARLPVLGLDALKERLGEFALAGADPLRNALDFSWSLLTRRGREVLPRLSALGGGFDLRSAAAAVGEALSHSDLLGGIGELADHSLLVVERGRVPRYRLLDTTRAYAATQISDADRRSAHLAVSRYFVDRLLVAESAWDRSPEDKWRDELAPDLDNLRGALGWALSPEGDAELGLALAGRAARLWSTLSLPREGRYWLETAVALKKTVEPAAEAALWRGLATILLMTEPERAKAAYRRAATLYNAAGDENGQGCALLGQGMMEMLAGALKPAERTLNRARRLLVRFPGTKSYGGCLSALAYVYAQTDRQPEALLCMEESLDTLRRTDDHVMIAQTELNLGEMALMAGDPTTAVARAESAIERLRPLHSARQISNALLNLSIYLEAAGDRRRAREALAEALPLAAGRDDEILGYLVELIALLRVDVNAVLSAKLAGWADAKPIRKSRPRQPVEANIFARLKTRLGALLAPVRLIDAMRDGAHWTDEQAVQAATGLLEAEDRPEPLPIQIVPKRSAN